MIDDVKYIREKLSQWTTAGATVYFVSVNPVDDANAEKANYRLKDSNIVSFNSEIKTGIAGNNIKYIVINNKEYELINATKDYKENTIVAYYVEYKTIENIDLFTDDASIMETAGYSVKAIVGSGKNIKITTPDDISIAEAIVKGEEEQ